MFINFFFDLKQASLPVSLKEYLMLMEAMNKRVVNSVSYTHLTLPTNREV